MRSLTTLNNSLRGSLIYFSERYYAKNVPALNVAMAGSVLTGRIEKDPHIHFKWAGNKIILPIDPRWITTSTAFGDFCHQGCSSAILSGIFQAKYFDRSKAFLVGSPLLLGIRLSPCIEVGCDGNRPPDDEIFDEYEDYDGASVNKKTEARSE